MTGLEIGKHGEEVEKSCIQKCNQCVTHMGSICESSATYIRSIYNPSCDSSETYMYQCLTTCDLSVRPICNVTGDPYVIHL